MNLQARKIQKTAFLQKVVRLLRRMKNMKFHFQVFGNENAKTDKGISTNVRDLTNQDAVENKLLQMSAEQLGPESTQKSSKLHKEVEKNVKIFKMVLVDVVWRSSMYKQSLNENVYKFFFILKTA